MTAPREITGKREAAERALEIWGDRVEYIGLTNDSNDLSFLIWSVRLDDNTWHMIDGFGYVTCAHDCCGPDNRQRV